MAMVLIAAYCRKSIIFASPRFIGPVVFEPHYRTSQVHQEAAHMNVPHVRVTTFGNLSGTMRGDHVVQLKREFAGSSDDDFCNHCILTLVAKGAAVMAFHVVLGWSIFANSIVFQSRFSLRVFQFPIIDITSAVTTEV